MARRKDSPQKAAMSEMMRDYLKNNDISIKDGTDVNSIMRDMMSVLLEGALDEELDEELGYSKYDYRNKETDNSRNGHSSKTMHTSYGDMDVAIPRDRNGEYEPQLIKKYQNTVSQDMEEKILSMYAKGMTTGDIESHMRELLCTETIPAFFKIASGNFTCNHQKPFFFQFLIKLTNQLVSMTYRNTQHFCEFICSNVNLVVFCHICILLFLS